MAFFLFDNNLPDEDRERFMAEVVRQIEQNKKLEQNKCEVCGKESCEEEIKICRRCWNNLEIL